MQKWGGSADKNIERKSKAEKKKAESKTSERGEIDWSKKRVYAAVDVNYDKLMVENICMCIMYDIFHFKSINLDIWIVLFSNNICHISGQLAC